MRTYRISLSAACLLSFALAGVSNAQTADARISDVPYASDSVYPLSIAPGLASVVEFESGEAIESVVVGDASNWNVDLTASADRLVVKPLAGANSTNMIVITTKRTYAFVLSAYGEGNVFLTRFSYPDGEKFAGAAYKYSGDRSIFPRLMSDNGKFTTIYWDRGAEIPAIFVIDNAGNESAAEFRATGQGVVLEGVHARIVFRLGQEKAIAQRGGGTGRRR
jgi:type IV secretion system protein VirB9